MKKVWNECKFWLFFATVMGAMIWGIFSPTAKETRAKDALKSQQIIAAEYGKFLPPPGVGPATESFRITLIGEKKSKVRLVAVKAIRDDGLKGATFTALIGEGCDAKVGQLWQGEWVWVRHNPGMFITFIVLTNRLE